MFLQPLDLCGSWAPAALTTLADRARQQAAADEAQEFQPPEPEPESQPEVELVKAAPTKSVDVQNMKLEGKDGAIVIGGLWRTSLPLPFS